METGSDGSMIIGGILMLAMIVLLTVLIFATRQKSEAIQAVYLSDMEMEAFLASKIEMEVFGDDIGPQKAA